jgi:hypothetical protein
LFVEIVFGFAKLLGIEPPVPGGELKIAAFALDHRLQLVPFPLGAGQSRFPEFVEQFVHPGGGFCHVLFQHEIRVGRVAQQFRPLDAQGRHAGRQVPVVEVIAAAAQIHVRRIEFLAQIAALRELEKRRPTGPLQRKSPLARVALGRGRSGGGIADGRGQSGQVLFVLDQQGNGVGLLQQIVAELRGKQR